MKNTSRVLILFCLLILLPALACNLPVRPRQAVNATQSARQTQQAQLFPAQAEGAAASTAEPATATAQPLPGPAQPVPTTVPPQAGQVYTYYAQPGDTLAAVAAHYGVTPEQVSSDGPLPTEGLLTPGQGINIPETLGPAAYPNALLPDNEIINGPAAADFDIEGFINSRGGYLSTYSEMVGTSRLSGAEIIRRQSIEQSINPRFLLGLLDYTSGWVSGQPKNKRTLTYPIGFEVTNFEGLSKELSLTARFLSQGYYGWRDGSLTELEFIGGQKVRISPQLNAGTVAVQYLFTKLLERQSWENALYGPNSFLNEYTGTMGDAWARDEQAGPVFPNGIQQPELALPFAPGLRWSLTGGPHISWGVGNPRGAIDLAPVTGEPACKVSTAWAQAAAPGVVVRSERNQVALDLDGDGKEQTGWVIFYYHIAEQDRVPLGSRLNTNDRIGHPSCEGGRVTGTHFHIARKYNGEWLPADGPLPFVMDGWTVHAGKIPYDGVLTKGDQIISARPDGDHESIVER